MIETEEQRIETIGVWESGTADQLDVGDSVSAAFACPDDAA